MTPAVVNRPILLLMLTVKQRAPSGPAVIPLRSLGLEVGTRNSVMTPPVVIRPILGPPSVNQRAPSDPAVMALALANAVGMVNSVMTPAVVIRPISLLSDS